MENSKYKNLYKNIIGGVPPRTAGGTPDGNPHSPVILDLSTTLTTWCRICRRIIQKGQGWCECSNCGIRVHNECLQSRITRNLTGCIGCNRNLYTAGVNNNNNLYRCVAE